MKKLLLLLSLFVLAGNMLFAQDDDLPPPSSKPDQTDTRREDQKPPNTNNFKGFGKDKKFDISKFIIEPIVNLSISQYQAEIGFSPSIGYRVWQNKNANPRWGNTGLFIGLGVTYRYNHFNEGNGLKYNYQTYGAGPLIQYNIWRGLFARVKLELLGKRYPSSYQINGTPSNPVYKVNYRQQFVPACLVGVGYNLLASKNIFVPIIVSYDLLHSLVGKNNSIYPRGITVQLGFVTLF